ncbi:MAG TPA: type II secretion system protein [Chthoniobacter sp.]|jgi:prepilin-type N-terminal cleavage/methylation domain-containing protein/prepilin-type processing-associated H-X9-DG protein
MKRARQSGFTVIELLVVIAIVATLVGLIFPVYSRVQAGGQATACLSNLRQIGAGLNAYLSDNNMMMPTLQLARNSLNDNVPVIDNTFDRYLTDKRVFVCPSDTLHLGTTTGTSYFWNVALNNQPVASLNFVNITTSNSHIPILSDKEGWHLYLDNKVNILYADGHVTKDLQFVTGAN